MSGERVLVTGAGGFVGPHVVKALAAAGYKVRITQRSAAEPPPGTEAVVTGNLASPVDWAPALTGVAHVVHLAGLAHAGPGLDEALYRQINTQATLDLAQAAYRAGVGRFIFISSIKAQTGAFDGPPLREDDKPAPDDAYGRSKLAAEQGLATLDLDWVALRPVLVYGPGVKANMAALVKLARLPLPLPLGRLNAPRSLLAVENLADAVLFALTPRCPVRRVFTLSDPEPIGVAGILAALRAGLGRKPGLLPVPPALLRLAAQVVGQAEAFDKLGGSLVARPEGLLRAGWRPPLSTQAGLERLARSRDAG